MKAVVLVGGFGTRLRPLTLDTPKPLLLVGHRPIVSWVVEHLARYGIDEVVLSLGFAPDAFFAAFPDGVCEGVRLTYAVEPEPLDTAGAIAFAADAAGIDETFVVVNGDVLADVDIGDLVAFHRASGAQGTIALIGVEDPSAFGVVPTDTDGRVVAFIEKPSRESAPTNQINAGTYVLEPSVLDRIERGRKVSIERVTFPAMVGDQVLFARSGGGYWLDAGRPDQYIQANLDVIAGRRAYSEPVEAVHPLAVIDRSALVIDTVVGAGASIDANAIVEGSVIGSDAVVGVGATIVGSALSPGSIIGDGASLTNCVIGAGVVIEPGAEHVDQRIPAPQ